MDLDDEELWYTQFHKKLYKDKVLKEMKKQYAEEIAFKQKEIKDLLKRINLIDKEIQKNDRDR